MAARQLVRLFLLVAILQAGCAGATTSPITNQVARSESGPTVYRYQPLNASATYGWSAEYRKSMDSANKALKRDPGDPVSLLRRGTIYAKAAQFEKAGADYEQAIDYLQLKPKTVSWSATLAELHMQRALLKRERNDRDGALKDLTLAVELAPSYWEPRFHRWQLRREMGETSEADADRAAGMKINPKVFSQTYDSKQGVI